MKRKMSVFLLIIIVLNQILFPIKMVVAENSNDFLNIKDEIIDESHFFDIAIRDSNQLDTIIVKLPKNVIFDQSSLETEGETNYEYDEIMNRITFSDFTYLKNVSFSLTDFYEDDNKLIVEAYKNGHLLEEKIYHFYNEINSESDKKSLINEEVLPEYPIQNVEVFNDKLQSDIKVVPLQEAINAGDDALYKIVLKVTGSQVKYSNVNLSVTLPTDGKKITFTQLLEELEIDGVVPTYDSETNQLNYQFEELESGQTYERILKINTKNGIVVNNTILPVDATMDFLDNKEIGVKNSTASIQVKSSGAMSIDKSVAQIVGGVAKPGGLIKWRLKIAVPKKTVGQLYLQPGTDITVEDILPSSLIYRSDIENGLRKPIVNGQNLLWKIPTPTIEEQDKVSDYLYTEDIEFWTEIKNDKKLINQTIKNKADIGGTFIGNDYNSSYSESDTSFVVKDSSGSTGSTTGGIVYPVHLGPLDTKGNIGPMSEKNPHPTGDESAYLGFSHNLWGYYYAEKAPLRSLELVYTVDPNLVFDNIEIMRDSWRFARNNTEFRENIPLTPKPRFDLVIDYKLNGKSQSITIEDPEYGKTYSRDELTIPKDAQVTKIRHVFKGDIPQGLTNNSHTRYYFTVKPGYEGKVSNSFSMIGESTFNPKNNSNLGNSNYYPFDLKTNFSNLYAGQTDVLGDRTANIVKTTNKAKPTAEIGIELLDNKNSVVETGTNRMKISFNNLLSSSSSIQAPIESVVLLPPGVKLAQKVNEIYNNDTGNAVGGNYEILSENYNDSGRQLVKVKWDEKYIRPRQKLTAELDVVIANNAPSSLYFDVYGFSGNQELNVPTVTNPNLLNTVKQVDTDDLNQNNNSNEIRIKSGNVYTLISPYDLQTEKFVKGPGEDWSKFGKTTPGGIIDYKLSLTITTGRDISSMTLIDVLPSEKDLGITDNISRESKFTPKFSGPIVLPKEWRGKVQVYYSESKTPKRDDLTRETNYPKGTEQLGNPISAETPNWKTEESITDWSTIHSFKIELLPGVTWIKGVGMNITYSMNAPSLDEISNKDIINPKINPSERAAWNSFAVATDKGQPVEPERVGIYIEVPTGNLTIKKVDSETKETLSNAKFELKNKKDGTTYELETDETGLAKIIDIPVGLYELKETKAPDGYRLLTKTIDIEIFANDNDQELIVENTKIGWELPDTGGSGILLSSVIGLMFMSVGLSLVRLRRV